MIGNTVQWDLNISTKKLPDSFYHESAPSFIDINNWPLFGPDIDKNHKLPAQIRFESGNPIL